MKTNTINDACLPSYMKLTLE